MRRSSRAAAAAAARAPPPPPPPRVAKQQRGVKREAPVSALASAAAAETASETPIKRERDASADLVDLPLRPAVWHALCDARQLSCERTLASGQTFAWRRHPVESTAQWSGVVGARVFALREREERVEFQCLHPADDASVESSREVLTHYFRLETDAVPLYAAWTQPSDAMARLIRSLPGHRLVRQDPVECLFAFICSSNNNIARIQQMVDKLRATYGTRLLLAPGGAAAYYAFPTAETLADKCEEATLRALGFGYRAPFIAKASRQLVALGGAAYLEQIRDAKPAVGRDAKDAYQEQLLVFAGVGRKVADCVALFSLERLEAIPVDTHVLQIARREFDAQLAERKSLSPALYRGVGDHFRARFTPFAGWAHSVLFTGDLTAFQSHLPAEVQKQKKQPVGAGAKRKNKAADSTAEHEPSSAAAPLPKKRAVRVARSSAAA